MMSCECQNDQVLFGSVVIKSRANIVLKQDWMYTIVLCIQIWTLFDYLYSWALGKIYSLYQQLLRCSSPEKMYLVSLIAIQ